MTITLDTIANLAKRRGFVFQSSEIYGGLRSAYDYGPLGVEVLRNVKEQWWRSMVQLRDDIVGLDSAILQSPEVWEASGHRGLLHRPAGGVHQLQHTVPARQARGPRPVPELRATRDVRRSRASST